MSGSINAVATYCDLFTASGLDATAFARWAISNRYALCVDVLDTIGSWPSSEPELKALQKELRG